MLDYQESIEFALNFSKFYLHKHLDNSFFFLNVISEMPYDHIFRFYELFQIHFQTFSFRTEVFRFTSLYRNFQCLPGLNILKLLFIFSDDYFAANFEQTSRQVNSFFLLPQLDDCI